MRLSSSARLNAGTSALALGMLASSLIATPAAAQETDAQDVAVLGEIIVTATKRNESLQDVPISVQAFDSKAIDDLNISSFDSYVKFLPNVTSGGRGPGQNSVYIRGMATATTRIVSAESTGSAPNVALYLDEAPVTAGGRNLDIYVTDVERIEVLAGPQGTLFGASAQAGALRMITKKPVLDAFEAGVKGKISTTRKGGDSAGVEGYINVPVIEDRLALRAAFYSINNAGYIDNVPATLSSAINIYAPAGAAHTTISNATLVKKDFNDSSYNGFRISGKYQLNDDWNVLVQVSNQTLQADGVFDHDPVNVGDLQVTRFLPDDLTDKFTQVAWTVEGRIGALELLYTGSYLDRHSFQAVDYSSYAEVGPFIPYYICDYPAYTTCGDPRYGIINTVDNKRQTHELRILTPQGNPLRAVAGVFIDDTDITLLSDAYIAGTIGNGFPQNSQIPGSTINAPAPRPVGVNFFNDMLRTESQIAVFGEVTFDITDQLSITGGARWYDMDVGLVGSANFGFRGATDGPNGINLDATTGGKPINEKDVIFKGNLTYRPNDDLMFYATYSEGFRPGLVNRIPGNGVPAAVLTDTVTNYELGWKMTLLDGRMRFNGAAYKIDWKDIQIAIQDPTISFLAFGANAGSAEIKGVEGDITFAATDNLTLFTSFSYNDTKLTEAPASPSAPLAPVGSELALTPDFQITGRARYQWQMGENHMPFVQIAGQYASDSWSSIVANQRFKQDEYLLVDAAIGVDNLANNWSAELFVENLTDKRAELFINDQDVGIRVTIPRPRTIGLRASVDF